MKIYTTIFLIFCSMIFCNYSQAHTLCVNKTSNYYGMPTIFDSNSSDWIGKYDWSSSSGGGTGVLTRRGVGICAVSGGELRSVASEIYRSRTSSASNKYCWTKLLYPAESKFILIAIYDDETECMQNCAWNAVNASPAGSSDAGGLFFQNLEGRD